MSKLKQKTFSNGLVVKHRKSAIFFENEAGKDENQNDFAFVFEDAEFEQFVDYLSTVACESWPSLQPKEANSFGSDYFEYYDPDYDNNGYLTLRQNKIIIEAPFTSKDRLYKFNKAKMQSFLFDLREQQLISATSS